MLRGARTLTTGASRGLGAAIADAWAERVSEVLLTERNHTASHVVAGSH